MKTTRQKTQEIEAHLAKLEAWTHGQETNLERALSADDALRAQTKAPHVNALATAIAAGRQAEADFEAFRRRKGI